MHTTNGARVIFHSTPIMTHYSDRQYEDMGRTILGLSVKIVCLEAHPGLDAPCFFWGNLLVSELNIASSSVENDNGLAKPFTVSHATQVAIHIGQIYTETGIVAAIREAKHTIAVTRHYRDFREHLEKSNRTYTNGHKKIHPHRPALKIAPQVEHPVERSGDGSPRPGPQEALRE